MQGKHIKRLQKPHKTIVFIYSKFKQNVFNYKTNSYISYTYNPDSKLASS